MINFYDSVYDNAMAKSITEQNKKQTAASVLKVFHETVNIESIIYVNIKYKYTSRL